MNGSLITRAYVLSGMPHILQAAEDHQAWQKLQEAYAEVRREIEASDADLILYFSTQWPSILGYMFQAAPAPEFVHVDQNWHQLGSIAYNMKVDAAFAKDYAEQVAELGYKTRLVDYQGFPIDTATVVVQKLINPDNRLPAAMVSCNMYSEKDETTRVGQAAGRALEKSGKKAIAVLVSNLSNRYLVEAYEPKKNRISSKKDDEWNRKILDLFAMGALEDVAQCAREFARQANADSKFKGVWWLNGLCGQSNAFRGKVLAYEAVWGTGAAVIALEPTAPILATSREQNMSSEEGSLAELVEELTDFEGRSRPQDKPAAQPVSSATGSPAHPLHSAASAVVSHLPDFEIMTEGGAEPVGMYPHARRYGDVLFLSGIGPRQAGSKIIPGVTLDADGNIVAYDVRVQTLAVIENIRKVLESAGSSLDKVIDVQAFLTNMKQDFKIYNEVYNAAFGHIRPTRTTVEVGALPTPIAVEFKVIARP